MKHPRQTSGFRFAHRTIAAEIARERGVPRVSARAVGQAVGSNPLCLLVPCHRVVGAGGRLVGYGGGLAKKATLLRLEGHAGGDTRPGRLPGGAGGRRTERICVSACLLGVPCRWKGDAKPCECVLRLARRAVVRVLDPATRRAMETHHAKFAEVLSHAESAENAEVLSRAESAEIAEVELVPFCPELAAGLGCPRSPIELVQGDGAEPSTASTFPPCGSAAPIRVLRVDRTGDATDALRAACEAEAEALKRTGGVDGFVLKARSPSCGPASPLHDAAGHEIGTAPGLWAALARERFPDADFRDETTSVMENDRPQPSIRRLSFSRS